MDYYHTNKNRMRCVAETLDIYLLDEDKFGTEKVSFVDIAKKYSPWVAFSMMMDEPLQSQPMRAFAAENARKALQVIPKNNFLTKPCRQLVDYLDSYSENPQWYPVNMLNEAQDVFGNSVAVMLDYSLETLIKDVDITTNKKEDKGLYAMLAKNGNAEIENAIKTIFHAADSIPFVAARSSTDYWEKTQLEVAVRTIGKSADYENLKKIAAGITMDRFEESFSSPTMLRNVARDETTSGMPME